jgi:hypothetical protein
MKAIRTIVATAAIVFALTTVAMAGAQRLAGPAEGETMAGAAAAHAGTPPTAAQPAAGTVTLSTKQFATLLRAARNTRAQDRDRDPSLAHSGAESRTHDRQKTRTHNGDDDTTRSATASSHTTKSSTHHTSTHHTAKQTSTGGGAHDGGTHDGGHDGGHD